MTQEVFLALMRSAHRYDCARGPLLSWLFGLARNCALRRLEKETRYQPLEEEPAEYYSRTGADESEEGPLEGLARSERLESIRRAVLALPLHYREAVVLCDLQELSYEDAARAIGCAVGTVRSRVWRGRAPLAERLRHERWRV